MSLAFVTGFTGSSLFSVDRKTTSPNIMTMPAPRSLSRVLIGCNSLLLRSLIYVFYNKNTILYSNSRLTKTVKFVIINKELVKNKKNMSAEAAPLQPSSPTQNPPQQRGAEQLGFLHEQQFPARAEEELAARAIDPEVLDHSTEQIAELGIAINPAAAPVSRFHGGIKHYSLLDQADKQAISESDNPLITLWGLTRLRGDEEQREHRVGTKDRHRLGVVSQEHELALLAGLGMVHGTQFEGLTEAIRQGKFVPNRAVSDSETGDTMFLDRDLGLDGYVFADFGRPHMHRKNSSPVVEVIFDLQAFSQPGAFATEKDIADTSGVEEYLKTVVEPEYFLEAAQLKLQTTVADRPGNDTVFGHKLTADQFAAGVDGNVNSLGNPNFSTWEMKIPEVATDYVKRIIFRKPEQYEAFVAEFGDTFPVQLVKPEEEVKYFDQAEVDQNEEKIARANATAFHEEATAKLNEMPDDAKEVVEVALMPVEGTLSLLHLERKFASGLMASLSADSPQDLQALVAKEPIAYIPGLEGVSPQEITDKQGRFMKVKVERTKAKRGPARFIEEPVLVKI